MAASIAAALAAGPPPLPTPGHVRAVPFVALAIVGFAISVLGHLFKSKTAVVTGILMLVAATVVLPLVLYVQKH